MKLTGSAARAWMVEGVGIGGFGGGSLEHPRQWLGAQWAGLFLGVHAAQNRQMRPEEAQVPSWGTAKGCALTMRPCSDGVVHGVCEDSLEVVQLEVLVHLVRARDRDDLQPAGREAVASGRDGRGAARAGRHLLWRHGAATAPEGRASSGGGHFQRTTRTDYETRVRRRTREFSIRGRGSKLRAAGPGLCLTRPSEVTFGVMQSAPAPSESTMTAIETELTSRVAQILLRSGSCHRCVLRFSGVRDVSLYTLPDDVLCRAASAAAPQSGGTAAAAAAVPSDVICPLCLGMLQQTLSPTSLEEVAADVCKVRS